MDITLAETRYLMFTTRAFATGVPTALAGTPVISAYENDSATQMTAGITLGVSHDSVVGMNLITVVATGANGYESGKDYNFVITTGTVGGVSVVGEVVGTLSIDASAALKAVDLLNDIADTDIVNGGAINVTSGAIDNVVLVSTTTANSDMVDISGLSTVGDIAALNDFDPAADTVANVALVATTTTNSDMRGTDGALTDKTGFSLSTAGILAIWHQLVSAIVTVGSIGKLIVDNIDGTISSRMPTTHIGATAGAIDNVVLVETTMTNSDMRGTDGAAEAVDLALVDAKVDSILVDTETVIPGLIAALNDFDPAADTVANVTLVATTTTNTDQRGTDSALTASSAPANFGDLAIEVTTGVVDSNVSKINGISASAINLGLSTGTIVAAAAIAGTLSATEMSTDLTETTDDFYNGKIIIWTSGQLKNQATDITDYDGATKILTFTATTAGLSATDSFIIV